MAFSTPDTQIAGYVVLSTDWNELVNNFNAVNNFFRQELWPDKEAHAPLSGVTAAGISVVESSGAAVNGLKVPIPIISFVGTADRARIWDCPWPRGYGVSAVLNGVYYMTGVNSDDEAVMESQIAATSEGDVSVTAKQYDALNQVIETVPDAVGTEGKFSIPLTNIDDVVASDWVSVSLKRKGTGGSDTANVGNLALKYLVVDFSLAT